MGQIFKQEKIGSLTEAGGTITLAPSTLNIGGQQYETESLQVVPAGTVAQTFYRVYAVRNAGNIELVVSANNNSVGPATYNSWKLVGHYYSGNSNGIFAISAATIDGRVNMPKITGNAYQTVGNSQSIGSSTVAIDLDAINYDVYDAFDLSTDEFITPRSGIYKGIGSYTTGAAGNNDRLTVRIGVGGGDWSIVRNGRTLQGITGQIATGTRSITKGDAVEIRASNDTSSVNLTGGIDQTFLIVSAEFEMNMMDEDL